MQRIKSITLENFKFFYGDRNTINTTNTLEINRNNVLLYGENGSGKSSIYWALYTFLQSALKENNGKIDKYFDPAHSQNLRNKFSTNTDTSCVEITFEDDNEITDSRKISFKNSNTKVGNFIKKTLDSSDFINYKYLSKIYDFRNSEPIDLFDMFEREVLMFVDFGEEYYTEKNALSGKTNAADWWKFIKSAPTLLPYNRSSVSVSSEEYKKFKLTTIPRFIELLKSFLLDITESANNYLKTEFKEEYSINFKVDTIVCDFNKNVSQRAKDGRLHKPKIPLELKYNNSELSEANKIISNPHTFLNEARLTAIALAIRLAMLDIRPSFNDSASILVLDDLLLSLDMSHRNIVLDIILKKTNEYQLFILTHDKFFFEMARHKIKGLEQTDWEYFEMYSNCKDGIPQPYITKSNTYIEKAETYLILKEYEVAGNFLRKATENFCKVFLPNRLQIKPDYSLQDLNGLIQQSINFAKNNGITSSLFSDLDKHRKFVLNSTSHDSYDVPKFNSEVSECLQTLLRISEITFKKDVFERGTTLALEMLNITDGILWRKEYEIQDDFRLIWEPGKDVILTKGIVNYKIFKDGVLFKSSNELASLKTDYDNWYSKSDSKGPTTFWEGITFVGDGRTLETIK
jgi:energy-coupling factor transporter ATP-binding protein EcfA2